MPYANDQKSHNDFNAIRLSVASPDKMLEWSHGEITKPETINYRTQKPEKDGLFCERIFGPSRDWECYCGKYKRIQYKGIICDKCGVEVTRSVVRRERMGHIKLSAPVSHIWFLRGVPSKIGLVLDMSVQSLEKVIYFANFIVTDVDDHLRDAALSQIDEEFRAKKNELNSEYQRMVSDIKKAHLKNADAPATKSKGKTAEEQELINAAVSKDEALKDLQDAVDVAREELKQLQKYQIISEQQYQDLSIKYGHVFEAGIGAEAVRKLLEEVNLDEKIAEIELELKESTKNRQRRLMRRLKLFKNLDKNRLRPEWMIMTILPVIPPDLRPMVQLDGGRYAASDLNDLYRRVINRNNRLKKLNELNAPEVIRRNEKRMLQEAVDALIDNSARHGKTVTAASGQKRQLKSLADMLKGKQGRFRQNLLGKRVDYSGRSVIVVGPHLKLNECGLPKKMALELFKPFVIAKLIDREYVHNVRSATRYIDAGHPEVWDILEEVTRDARVLLNRAPTLHRLGIQAFKPVLIEGLAIQIHPLVCTAFNADFDGDQMAVHVPLTERAKWEAHNIMESSKNLLKPATGDPIVSPSQDIVLGAYYLTQLRPGKDPEHLRTFGGVDEAVLAYEHDVIGLQEEIRARIKTGKLEQTTVGRLIFNGVLPEKLPYVNKTMNKGSMSNVVHDVLMQFGMEETVALLDRIKELSFEYLTRSGMSWAMSDLPVPVAKKEILEKAELEVEAVMEQFETGLLTEEEKHVRVTDIWTRVKNEVTEAAAKVLDPYGPVLPMIESKARGSWGQLTQMVGMKGLVTNPAGDIIELPVKKSFKEGFDVLEFFISTHGTRKGLSDTALRTANAGYLTRRLVDVAQEVVTYEEDCHDTTGTVVTKQESEDMSTTLADRVWGRVVLEDVVHPKTGKVIVKSGGIVDRSHLADVVKCGLLELRIRSVLTCKAERGICRACYGNDLGR
ncbi:MAG: DNA-directed RNA polymerase subunit beta', partial [Candidatus Kerfeldbacteria bacterium]|nr:DNA-directed RNA polymerase subunit beta' [Candidatus Kerfeldbacteria bacterium]